jgi:hypothetical protein
MLTHPEPINADQRNRETFLRALVREGYYPHLTLEAETPLPPPPAHRHGVVWLKSEDLDDLADWS